MVEAIIKNLDSIDQDTSKKKVRDKNFEVIEATKETVQEKVDKIVSDLKEALSAITASVEDRNTEEVEKIKKSIEEAIKRVQNKNNNFKNALNKLCKENKKNDIQEKTLENVKTKGNELSGKYNKAKALHEKNTAKTSEKVVETIIDDVKKENENVPLEVSEAVVIGDTVVDDKAVTAGKNESQVATDKPDTAVEGEKKIDLRLQEVKTEKTEMLSLIEKISVEIKKIGNIDLATAKEKEFKSIIGAREITLKDREEKLVSIKAFLKEVSKLSKAKKDFNKSGMEIPGPNRMIKRTLPNSLKSVENSYGGEKPHFLCDFEGKLEFTEKDKESLVAKKLKLERRIAVVKGDDQNGFYGDRTLKDFVNRMKGLIKEGNQADAEVYKEDLLNLFNNGLEKLKELEERVEKSIPVETTPAESGGTGKEKTGDTEGEEVATEESLDDLSQADIDALVGTESSEGDEQIVKITNEGQELPVEVVERLEDTEPVVEGTVDITEVEDSIVDDNTDNSKSSVEHDFNKGKEVLKKEKKVTDNQSILSQDEVDALLDEMGESGDKSESGKEVIEYDAEKAGDSIDAVDTLASLRLVAEDIVANNIELLTKSNVEKGAKSALNQFDKYLKDCDIKAKGHTPYFKNYFDGECGLRLLDKMKEIMIADENSTEVENLDNKNVVSEESVEEAEEKGEENTFDDEQQKHELSDEQIDQLMDASNEVAGKIKEAIGKIEDEVFKQKIIEEKVAMYGDINDSDDYEEILEKYQNFLDRINTYFEDLKKQRKVEARKQKPESTKGVLNDDDNVASEEIKDDKDTALKSLKGKEITLPEFIDGEVKIKEELEATIEETLLANGIPQERVKAIVSEVETVLGSVIDAEAERDFSKILKHHKLKLVTGVGIGMAATAATTAIRSLGGTFLSSGLKNVFGAASGAALGMASGGLRAKFKEYLNPKIAKLREGDDKKLAKVQNEKADEILKNEDNVRLAIEAVIKVEVNKGKFEQGDFREIMDSLNVSDKYRNLSEEQKTEIAKSMLCLNNLVAVNGEKLVGFLDKKKKGFGSKWKEMSATKKGAILGGVFGSITSLTNAIASNSLMSSVAGGAVSGLISGTMMGGTLKDWLAKNKVDKESRKMMEEIDSFESGEKEAKIGTLRVYLESGALDKYPLAIEKARVLLIDKLVEGDFENEIDSDFKDEEAEKKISKKFELSKTKKVLAYSAGILGGIATGSGFALGTKYLKAGYQKNGGGGATVEKGGHEVVGKIKAEGGVKDYAKVNGSEPKNLNNLKNNDVARGIIAKKGNNNIETTAQSDNQPPNTPKNVNNGVIQTGKATSKLIEQQKDLQGLDAGKLLDKEQIGMIKNYQKVLNNDKFSGIIKDGLSQKEILKLNHDIYTKYSEQNGVLLNNQDISRVMKSGGDKAVAFGQLVRQKQNDFFGVKSITEPLSAEEYNVLKDYHEKANVIKEALKNNIYDKPGLEKLVLKDETGINLDIAKNQAMISEFNKVVSVDMSAIKYAKIGHGDSISGVLNQSMSADSKVVLVNSDGVRMREPFDANLVHEGDTVVQKGDEIYVFKTSGIKVHPGDSLEGIYQKIDARLEEEGIPEDIKNHFGQQDGNGEFTSQVNKTEAADIRKFWRSLNKDQQEQWQKHQLSPAHREAILEKGGWTESWTTVDAGATVEAKYVSVLNGDNGHPTNFELKVFDNKLSDGIPDEVQVKSIQGGYERIFERKDNMDADTFSASITAELNRVGIDRSARLSSVLENNKNLSIDQINASGLNQFDNQGTFKEKISFWNDNNRFLDTNKKAKDFFTLLDKSHVNATKGNMKFIIDGDVAGITDRVNAVNFVDTTGIDISYIDATKYSDKLESFSDIGKVEAVVKMLKNEDSEANLKKIFDVSSSTKYSYNKDTGVYKLYDVKLGKDKVDILFSKDKNGKMKFGYDGPGLINEGTKGHWNSIRPNTELSEQNIEKLQNHLSVKFEKTRASQEALDNQNINK